MLKRPPTGSLGVALENRIADAVAERRENRASRLPNPPMLDWSRGLVAACLEGNTPCDDMIVEANVRALRDRSRVGLAKYGHTLDRDDLTTTAWIEHLRQELLDGANYAERLACDLSTVESRWRERERERFMNLVRRHRCQHPQGSPACLAFNALLAELEQPGGAAS